MNETISCSSCGGVEDLHLVTYRYEEGTFSGRVLVYCLNCRSAKGHMIDVSIPLALVTPELFFSLYELGKTESDPEFAVSLVFSRQDPDLVRRIESVL